jgi:hypothetical protein
MSKETSYAIYEIQVERYVGTAVSTNFSDLSPVHRPDGTTSFIGTLPDQAALHGILAQIRDLGLVLVAVKRHPQDPLLP